MTSTTGTATARRERGSTFAMLQRIGRSLMMPIAVRSRTEAAALTTGETRPISNTTRSGSLATPRMVK